MRGMHTSRMVTRLVRSSWLALCLLLVACHQDMYIQAKYGPDDTSTFFNDGRANRPPVPNTVAIGQYGADPVFLTGKQADGQYAATLPMELTEELVRRGQNRYNVYCAPCHGLLGDGNGVIAKRGPIQVPTYHTERLRTIPVGYMFEVITNGVGRMYSYASRVPPEDRWAIAAYVRALQFSQDATLEDLPPEQREQVQGRVSP